MLNNWIVKKIKLREFLSKVPKNMKAREDKDRTAKPKSALLAAIGNKGCPQFLLRPFAWRENSQVILLDS